MKNLLFLLLIVMIISCNQNKKEGQETEVKSTTLIEKSKNFDWLLGNWKRLNEKDGKETFENWEKIKETEYSGIGFTMLKNDTIKQEKIRLIKNNEKWDLKVKSPEDTTYINFTGVSHNDKEFTCENNELDFPNKIKYWKNGSKLNASVSGGEMIILFEFEKLND